MPTTTQSVRPQEREYLEDYEVGEVFVSPARTLTEADVVAFASLTGDWHPLHTDAVYAGQSPFGERIAHGMLTLSVGMVLVLRLGENRYLPKHFIAMSGIDGLRFTAPVRLGDTIHSVNRVAALDVKDERRGVLQYESEIRNQDGRTVVVWTSRMLVGRRPAGE
ncbi:MAG: MaoC family dehydratase N-terminal domain-containing protein [Acidobacteria bacterium]|nr:MaoC family dehydratase N-terminal domain-containing protein [Acidobacteriota bacterium]